MSHFAQVLEDIAPKPSTTFSQCNMSKTLNHILTMQYVQNPKFIIGHKETNTSRPTDIHQTEPRPKPYKLGSTEMAFAPTEVQSETLCTPSCSFWNHRVKSIETTEIVQVLRLSHIRAIEWIHLLSLKCLTFEYFTLVGVTKFLTRCHRVVHKGV